MKAMKEFSTVRQEVTREEAISSAAYILADVRGALAGLYSWSLSGGEDYSSVLAMAQDVVQGLHRVMGMAWIFSHGPTFNDDVNSFFEEARTRALQIRSWREAIREEVR